MSKSHRLRECSRERNQEALQSWGVLKGEGRVTEPSDDGRPLQEGPLLTLVGECMQQASCDARSPACDAHLVKEVDADGAAARRMLQQGGGPEF